MCTLVSTIVRFYFHCDLKKIYVYIIIKRVIVIITFLRVCLPREMYIKPDSIGIIQIVISVWSLNKKKKNQPFNGLRCAATARRPLTTVFGRHSPPGLLRDS